MKYVITVLCNDDGEFYTECVNKLFDSYKAACDAAYECAKQEVESLNELAVDETELRDGFFFTNEFGDDEVSVYQRGDYAESQCTLITRYNVHHVSENQNPDTLDLLMIKYPNKTEQVGEELLRNAFTYFESLFETDAEEGTYGCGSIEKLTEILGKDYRDSDLLFEIARNFEECFDPEYDIVIEAWKAAIKNVVGEDAFERAFEEGDLN